MSADYFALIERAVSDYPERIALVTPDGQAVTYKKIARTINAFAATAVKAGLKRHDHVAIEIDNYAVQVCLIIALSRLGAVTVMGSSTEAIMAAGIHVDAVITIEPRATTKPRKILFNQAWFESEGNNGGSAGWAGYSESCDVALIAATSGTTGKKRFMPFSVAKLAARIAKFDPLLGSSHRNRLITMGVETVIGFSLILRTLRDGGLILQPANSPRKTLELVNFYGITEIITIPNVLVDFIKSQRSELLKLTSLKQIVVVGSPISIDVAHEAQEIVCPNVLISYGASEIGPIAAATIDDLDDVKGAAGFVGAWVKGKTVGDDNAELPAGEAGRLKFYVSSALRVDEYLNADPSEADTLKDGWFYPGDLGYVTKEGMLVVTGRITDLINVGGNKMSPDTITAMIVGREGVRQAGVVGLVNADGFDDVCVAVVGQKSFNVEQLRAFLVGKLGTNTPLRVELVRELPVNLGGKIDRAKLRARFQTAVQ